MPHILLLAVYTLGPSPGSTGWCCLPIWLSQQPTARPHVIRIAAHEGHCYAQGGLAKSTQPTSTISGSGAWPCDLMCMNCQLVGELP